MSSNSIIEKSSPKLNELFYGFLADYSENTSKAYRGDLRSFFTFLREVMGTKGINVSRSYIVAYKEYMINHKLSNSTINRRLACLSAFYTYLLQEDLIKASPAVIRRTKLSKQSSTIDLSDDQAKELINSLSTDDGTQLLRRAIVITLLNTGMRNSELRSLTFECIQQIGETVCFKFTRKGGAESLIPINTDTLSAITDFIEWCGDSGKYTFNSGDYIFRPIKNSRGDLKGPISINTVNAIVKDKCANIGIRENITAHSMRSTFAGHLLDKNVPIQDVADLLDHSSVDTTRKYYYKRLSKIEKSPIFDVNYLD